MTYSYRINAFCDWAVSIADGPSFDQRPEFAFLSDLTETEFLDAEHELLRRYEEIAHKQDFAKGTCLSQASYISLKANDN